MIAGLVQRDWSEIAVVGGPFEGATVDANDNILSTGVTGAPPTAIFTSIPVSRTASTTLGM